MNTKTLDFVFAFLIISTLVTWFVGQSGVAGPAAVALILGLAFIKGWFILREFMMLKRASPLWTLLVGGWLALILTVIALTYWKALP